MKKRGNALSVFFCFEAFRKHPEVQVKRLPNILLSSLSLHPESPAALRASSPLVRSLFHLLAPQRHSPSSSGSVQCPSPPSPCRSVLPPALLPAKVVKTSSAIRIFACRSRDLLPALWQPQFFSWHILYKPFSFGV